MERLDPGTTTILVVDVQEKLAPAMDGDALERLIANAGILLDAAKILGVPVITSEQYPKGLGPTIPAIAEKITVPALPKMTFDAVSDITISRALGSPRSVVVLGMETHVCVFQTVRELVRRGVQTCVLADAVASRKKRNMKLGLELCSRAGAFVMPTETVLFDLLERAGTDKFKAISKLIR